MITILECIRRLIIDAKDAFYFIQKLYENNVMDSAHLYQAAGMQI